MLHRTFVIRDSASMGTLIAFLKSNAPAMAKAGTPIAVDLTEYKAKRSLPQNRRYFGVVLKQIAENAWVGGKQFSPEAWHEELAGRFIGKEQTPSGGWKAISTTTLDVGSFTDFMTQCEQFAATELGIELQ